MFYPSLWLKKRIGFLGAHHEQYDIITKLRLPSTFHKIAHTLCSVLFCSGLYRCSLPEEYPCFSQRYRFAARYPGTWEGVTSLSSVNWDHPRIQFACVPDTSGTQETEKNDTKNNYVYFHFADADETYNLEKFIQIVQNNDLRIFVWNLFSLDYTFVYGLVGLTTSYAIILIQMNA